MEDFDLRKYLNDNVLLKEDSEIERWNNMGKEERLYTLFKYIDDPDEAESYVDASYSRLPSKVFIEKKVEEEIDEVFDPEGDYNMKYEIDDYEIGDEVVVLPNLTTDPLNKQGVGGVVTKVDIEMEIVEVTFKDRKTGRYYPGAVVFPGDENYIHPEEEEEWVDPAGGTHYGDEDDPAAAYIEEGHDCEKVHPGESHEEWEAQK